MRAVMDGGEGGGKELEGKETGSTTSTHERQGGVWEGEDKRSEWQGDTASSSAARSSGEPRSVFC